jgi:hypothetical protein
MGPSQLDITLNLELEVELVQEAWCLSGATGVSSQTEKQDCTCWVSCSATCRIGGIGVGGGGW